MNSTLGFSKQHLPGIYDPNGGRGEEERWEEREGEMQRDGYIRLLAQCSSPMNLLVFQTAPSRQ